MEEFVIRNRILTDYFGTGTEIVVPEGLEAIDNYVFAYIS